MTRRALIVGIDDYDEAPLTGCVKDAEAVAEALAKNHDGTPNFFTLTLTSMTDTITRSILRARIADLFSNAEGFDLVFYFAGHGATTQWGAELVTTDYEAPNSYGVSMNDIAVLARRSSARTVTVLLDCCYSGDIGNDPGAVPNPGFENAELRTGMMLLTATRSDELAIESGGHGVFTRALLSGLGGGCADLLGRVTAHGLYAYVCRTFGDAWVQQPVFKAHSSGDIVLRSVDPSLSRDVIRRIVEHFPDPADVIYLSPDDVDSTSVRPLEGTLEDLVALGGVGLVLFEPERDGVTAALVSGSARLTQTGIHYRQLVEDQMV